MSWHRIKLLVLYELGVLVMEFFFPIWRFSDMQWQKWHPRHVNCKNSVWYHPWMGRMAPVSPCQLIHATYGRKPRVRPTRARTRARCCSPSKGRTAWTNGFALSAAIEATCPAISCVRPSAGWKVARRPSAGGTMLLSVVPCIANGANELVHKLSMNSKWISRANELLGLN